MPMMPYHVEKGAAFTIFESFVNDVNGSPSMAVKVLRALRNPTRTLDDSKYFDDATLTGHAPMAGGTWAGHFMQEWLGPSQSPGQDWTGYWIGYRGDVSAIVRLTLRRALEAALGVDHNAAVPDSPPRHWPIQILWHCGQPWFEGWVAWNQRPRCLGRLPGPLRRLCEFAARWRPERGDVTVLFATPGHIGGVVRRRLTAPPGRQGRDYEQDPLTLITPSGARRRLSLMVVSHRDHARHDPSEIWRRSRRGQWRAPSIVTHVGQGEVITVAPSEAEGGVLADGRRYQPGP